MNTTLSTSSLATARPRVFPLPRASTDLTIFGPSNAVSPAELFSLLTDRCALDWHDKVGPNCPTRLLLSQGWVAKTHVTLVSPSLAELQVRVTAWMERTQRLRVWHPQKCWFILHQADGYWPCSVTPCLTTIRELIGGRGHAPRVGLWQRGALLLRKYLLQVGTFVRHGIVLDPSTKNFGLDGSGSLYYIDDEIYRCGWKRYIKPYLKKSP